MTLSAAVTEAAPAKVNLALHVIGQRADGDHLLDSLFGLAVGGRFHVRTAELGVDRPVSERRPEVLAAGGDGLAGDSRQLVGRVGHSDCTTGGCIRPPVARPTRVTGPPTF